MSEKRILSDGERRFIELILKKPEILDKLLERLQSNEIVDDFPDVKPEQPSEGDVGE
jgi:hypothetical protein